jgi:hypothetical protein
MVLRRIFYKMQADNTKGREKEKRLNEKQEMIRKVVTWLREEGMNPEDKTSGRDDASYFARIVTKPGKESPQGQIIGEEGFHVFFPATKIDSVTISELIELKYEDRQAYKSLAAKQEGILRQNRFYFDLQLALLQKNVFFVFEGGVRELKSLEVSKVVFFDGLTKDKFFDTYITVDTAVAIARIKLRQLRDEILPSKAWQTDDDSSDLR